MPATQAGMRRRISEFLPHALEKAIASYQQFMEKEHDEKQTVPKGNDFKIHHDACKVALAHIELLVKLAHWADLPDPALEDENHQRILQSLIEQAQGELDG